MTQKYVVRLSRDERKILFQLLKEGSASKEKQNRARILLKADCGEEGEKWKDPQIAEAFYVSVKTVERVRKSLVEEGFEDTINRKLLPHGNREKIIKGEEEAYLIALTCSEPPEGYAKWTLSLFTKVTEQRTRTDWAYYIREIVDNEQYKDAEKIIFVMDNLNTHHKSSLYETFEPHEAKRIADKFDIHYMPKHGSWLNMAEIELSHLSRQCLDQRLGERAVLDKEVKAWTKARNEKKIIANWQFTTTDARIKLRKLYPTI
jgi:hypothetical protein